MRRSPVLLTFAALAFVASACSGGNDDAERKRSSTTSTTEPEPNELCSSLAADPYEARKASLAAASEADQAECSALVSSLRAAMDVEERTRALKDKVDITITCADEAQATITNRSPHPIGFTVVVRTAPEAAPEGPDLVGSPSQYWQVDPGQVVVTDKFPVSVFPGTCTTTASLFLADGSPADASVPEEKAEDEQADNDPAVWFPALLDAEDAWAEASDPNGPALTEDLRSLEYRDLVEGAPEGPGPMVDRAIDRQLCEVLPGPDPDHVGIIYHWSGSPFSYTDEDGTQVDVPASTETRVGAFRRGADGRWRWLIHALLVSNRSCLPR